MRRRWVLLGAWVLLLLASHLFEAVRPWPSVHGDTVRLPVFDGAEPAGEADLVFEEHPVPGAPRLLLLHGSPGQRSNFDEVTAALGDRVHWIAPDLYGYGESRSIVPDYSIEAQARSLAAWLEAREESRVHLVGFSLGGGVALHLTELVPERIASITLVSSIGVQELEWLGSYELNHALHGLQLGAWHLGRWLLPHFGSLSGARGYMRGFFDSDQRPLRGLLEELSHPTLIVHGARDFLVPVEAAEEHHRLVAHSELVRLEEEGHFLPWTWTGELADKLTEFAKGVEAGEVSLEATPERIARASRPFDPSEAPGFSGPMLLAILFLLAASTLVSEDLTCFTAGLLVSQGRIEFFPACAACFTGIFIGDVGLYFAGRLFGRTALTRAPMKWVVTEAKVERSRLWFERQGAAVIFLSRFLPGLRLPTYFAAGVVGTRITVFCFWFAVAGVIWTPALVGASSLVGDEARAVIERFGAGWGLLAVIGALILLKTLVFPLFTWRGRRRLWGRIQKLWRWEFWPPLLFYPPIALWIAWLAIRHRGVAALFASNPSIPTGGFVGESKSQILSGFGEDSPRIAKWIPIEPGNTEAASAFAERVGYPVVLKPDIGQRGSGVQVLRSEESLLSAVTAARVTSILQAFAPGPEFGVFYARRPDEEHGRIISITEKVIPEVVGDGVHTLERLILSDKRAVCAAKAYLEANETKLDTVLAEGERFPLVDLGTHSRGAVFLDGERWNTPELTAAIDKLSKDFDGFYFGRYDLRVPSGEALARGEDFLVIELNGVTSESTSVYDPKHSVLFAWRTLMAQWSLAFAIGAENHARGVRNGTLAETIRAWLDYRQAQSGHASGHRDGSIRPSE